MKSETSPAFKYRFLWLAIGYALVALVLYLSLASSPVDLELRLPYEDKFFHALAYFSLMVWFAQIYHGRLQRYMIAIALVLTGVILEYLQSFDPNRYYEFADMLANSFGVALAFVITLSAAKNILLGLENRLS